MADYDFCNAENCTNYGFLDTAYMWVLSQGVKGRPTLRVNLPTLLMALIKFYRTILFCQAPINSETPTSAKNAAVLASISSSVMKVCCHVFLLYFWRPSIPSGPTWCSQHKGATRSWFFLPPPPVYKWWIVAGPPQIKQPKRLILSQRRFCSAVGGLANDNLSLRPPDFLNRQQTDMRIIDENSIHQCLEQII